MPKYSFSKLVESQWVEQEKVSSKSRRAARKLLAESGQIKDSKDKKVLDPAGTWKIHKVGE